MLIFKAVRKLYSTIRSPFYTPIAYLLFYLNGAKIGKGLKVRGLIKVFMTRRGKITVGTNLKINSGNNYNMIGRQQKTLFWVEGHLTIGDNVGISFNSDHLQSFDINRQ